MASFNYMNNSAPFWDYVANLEQRGNNHPFFGRNHHDHDSENDHGEGRQGLQPSPFDPFRWGNQFFGGPEGLPHHRGPPAGPHDHPAPNDDDQSPRHEHDGLGDGEKGDNDQERGDNDNDNGEGPSKAGSDGEGGRHCGRGRHGRCGSRRGRHGFGGRGGFGPHHGGPGSRGPRGPHGNLGFPFGSPPPPEGPHGGPHRHGPHGHHHPGRSGGRAAWGCNVPFSNWCQMRSPGAGADCNPASIFSPFFSDFLAGKYPNKKDGGADDNEDFTPEADIFDTPSSYFIHISLPGAKKEDVGVNWDAEKSELSVAGVIYRPGDEEFLKMLAMDERRVGPFERKIRLGTRANPARVDADSITAKLEDGVLKIEVRKEEEGFIEIKKVDVE